MRPKPFGCNISTANPIMILVLASNGRNRVFSIGDRQIGLIDLNQTFKPFAPATHHGSPESMQHCPCGLIATQAQHALQTQCAHPLLLIREIPRRRQPDPQRCTSLVKDGARRHSALMPAVFAHQPNPARAIRHGRASATRARKSARPSQSFEIGGIRLLGREPIQKLVPRAGIVAFDLRYHRLYIIPGCWRLWS